MFSQPGQRIQRPPGISFFLRKRMRLKPSQAMRKHLEGQEDSKEPGLLREKSEREDPEAGREDEQGNDDEALPPPLDRDLLVAPLADGVRPLALPRDRDDLGVRARGGVLWAPRRRREDAGLE